MKRDAVKAERNRLRWQPNQVTVEHPLTEVKWTNRGVTYQLTPATVEEKRSQAAFDRLHPRDRRGLFVETDDPVTLTGGVQGTFQGVDARSGRVRVRVNGRDRLILRSQVTFGEDKPSGEDKKPPPKSPSKPSDTTPATGAKPPKKPEPEKTPEPEPAPKAEPASAPKPAAEPKKAKAKIFREEGQDPKSRADMAASQRASINDLNIDNTTGYSEDAQAGAAAVRVNGPMTAEQANALAVAVRGFADAPDLPKARKNSLNKGAEWLDVVSAQLGGFSRFAVDDADRFSSVDVDAVKPGDVIALPGWGGEPDMRKVTEVVPWYGVFKYTMEDADGKSENRFVAPETPVHRFDGAKEIGDVSLDGGDSKDREFAEIEAGMAAWRESMERNRKKEQEEAAKKKKPFIFAGSSRWYDQMELLPDDVEPFKTVDLVIEKYDVKNGVAWRSKGRSYVVELKPGETPEAAKKRMDEAVKNMEKIFSVIPEDKAALQRGIAILQGRNPADDYWAKQYNMPGFRSAATGGGGGTTSWGGDTPDTGTIAHEFGHNVDSQRFGTREWVSTARHSTLPGQTKSWSTAMFEDERTSLFYKGNFREEYGHEGHSVILGDTGVTSYGKADIKEDFAEAVRLWLMDRRDGKLGEEKKTGEKVRFSDLFPERAKVLDAAFETATDHETLVRERRREEGETFIFDDFVKAGSEWKSSLSEFEVMEKTGLPLDDVKDAWVGARRKFAAHEKNKKAQEAADADAMALSREIVEAAARAAGIVASVREALDRGRLEKADASKIRSRVSAYKRKLRTQGVSEGEVARLALHFEAEALMKYFGQ